MCSELFYRKVLCGLSLLGLWLLPGSAGTFTIESAAAYAGRNNPDLKAARQTVEEARARVLQAGGLPNPELETEVLPNLAGREFSAGIFLSRKFPLTQRLKLEKAASITAVHQAEAEIDLAQRALQHKVRALVVQRLGQQAASLNLQQQRSAARELAASASRAADVGEAALAEKAQFELEAAQLEVPLLRLGLESERTTGALRPLLGLPAGEAMEIKGSLPPPSATAPAPREFTNHPGWQAAVLKAENAHRSIALARAARWEDFTLGIGYERTHNDDAGAGMERDNAAILRFSIPLPLRRHNAGHVEEAQAAAVRADLEAAAMASGLKAEAAAAAGEMKALANLYGQTKNRLLPQAVTLEQQIIQLRKSGQGTVAAELGARRQRLDLESAALDALRDWHLARIRYEAAIGK